MLVLGFKSTIFAMNFKYFLTYATFFIKSVIKNPLTLSRLILYLFYKLNGQDIIIYDPPQLKGFKMELDLNSHMDKGIFFSGLLGEPIETNLVTFLSKYLKRDSVFFDIGSNSGYFSILASSIAKDGFIHAFEPVRKTYKIFKKTIRLNRIKNIRLNNVCLGAKRGVIKFYVDKSSDVSSLQPTSYQKQTRQVRCQMIRLTDYCRRNSLKRIDIIKIDTEGAEKDILFNSEKILVKYKPILIVEFSSETAKAFGYHPNELYNFLHKVGYKIYSYKNGRLKLQQKQKYYPAQDLYCFITK